MIGYVASACLAVLLIIAQYVFLFDPAQDPFRGPANRPRDILHSEQDRISKLGAFRPNSIDKIIVSCLRKLRLRRNEKAAFGERRIGVALRDVSSSQDSPAYV